MSNAAMNLTEEKFGWTREEMAQRAALDIPNGTYVNLGIGIPELVARFVPEGREVIYHTENGLLGMGPVGDDGGEPEGLVQLHLRAVHHAALLPLVRLGEVLEQVHAAARVSAAEDRGAAAVAQRHHDLEGALCESPWIARAEDEVREEIDQVRAAFQSRTSSRFDCIHQCLFK